MSTAIVTTESTALSVVERAKLALGISPENEQELREMAGRTTDIVTITNADGYQQIHSARMALKNARVEIEKKGKKARQDSTDFSKAVIAEEKRAIGIVSPEEDRLQTLQTAWDDAREAEKQARIDAELDRIADLQARVTYLGGNPTLTSLMDPALLADHIRDLEVAVIDESFEEYRERADAAKATGIARLQALHDAAVERVAEAVRVKAEREELAKLRAEQVERDRIAQEALKTEREEQERVAAQERARIAEEERQARVARDAETARHNEQLRLQREEEDRKALERQAVVDADNARIAEANRIEAARIASERAEFEQRQAAERKEKQEEEARRAEQARIAALVRPSDEEMIDVLAIHYSAPNERVVEWILTMDLSDRAAA